MSIETFRPPPGHLCCCSYEKFSPCASEDICDRGSHSLIFILSDGWPGGRRGSVCSYAKMSLVLEALSFITPGPSRSRRKAAYFTVVWLNPVFWVLMMAESDTQCERLT